MGNGALSHNEKFEFNEGMSLGAPDAHETSGDFERSQRQFLFGTLKDSRAAFEDLGFAQFELSAFAAVKASGGMGIDGSQHLGTSIGEAICDKGNKQVFEALEPMSNGGLFSVGASGESSVYGDMPAELINAQAEKCERLQLCGGVVSR